MDPRFFLPCFHGFALGPLKEGKNSVYNVPYGPHTRLIRGSYYRDQSYNCSHEHLYIHTYIYKYIHTYYSDWVCTAVMSNDVMKDLRG